MSIETDGRPMSVLIADDDAISRRLLQVSLTKSGYQVVIANDGMEALGVLRRPDSPKLAILDWMMPGMDGVEVCRAIRGRAGEPYVYILLLTAKGHAAEVVEGLEAGADDYIRKPFDLHELKARLRAGRRILDLQQQLVSAGERLRVQATYDSLTGLLNRPVILEGLDREVARSGRERNELAVLMADIDHFKSINDSRGHLVGDAVLRQIAERMQSAVRVYDSVGRYGGEEFLIVCPGCNSETAGELAERIRVSVSSKPVCVSGQELNVTLSIGVAVTGNGLRESTELLRTADDASYMAKRCGRDRVEVQRVLAS